MSCVRRVEVLVDDGRCGPTASVATADLQGELATLAVGAAWPSSNKNLDPAPTQLIEDYINQVGTS